MFHSGEKCSGEENQDRRFRSRMGIPMTNKAATRSKTKALHEERAASQSSILRGREPGGAPPTANGLSSARQVSRFEINWRNILVPVDFSPASRRGLQFAGSIAGSFASFLHLLHVIEPPVMPQWGYVHLALREAKLRRAAAQELKSWGSGTGLSPQLIAATEIRSGIARSEICQAAVEAAADLIVMASHGLGFQHALLGSTAERVVRGAPCHVLVIQDYSGRAGPTGPQVFSPRRLVLTTDFSTQSLSAFPYATALARKFGAAVTLLHVVPSHLPLELSQLGVVVREQRLLREAREQMSKTHEKHFQGDSLIQPVVLVGAPAHDICTTAKNLRADLIVMSTHGHTGLKHYLLGSVVENVLRHAPCPMLVIRQAMPDTPGRRKP